MEVTGGVHGVPPLGDYDVCGDQMRFDCRGGNATSVGTCAGAGGGIITLMVKRRVVDE